MRGTVVTKGRKLDVFFSHRAERRPAVSGTSTETESPCFPRCYRRLRSGRRQMLQASGLRSFLIAWKSCRRTRFRLKVSGDQARTFIKAQVSPGPLEHYYYTIPKSDQKQDMDEQPCHPGGQSAQMQKVQVRDSFIPSDCRHTALVEIPKALWISPFAHS